MYMHYRMTAGMFELGSFPNSHTISSPVSITERIVENVFFDSPDKLIFHSKKLKRLNRTLILYVRSTLISTYRRCLNVFKRSV